MVYVLTVTTVVLLGVMLWLAHRKRLGGGLRAYALLTATYVSIALFFIETRFPNIPRWQGVLGALILTPLLSAQWFKVGARNEAEARQADGATRDDRGRPEARQVGGERSRRPVEPESGLEPAHRERHRAADFRTRLHDWIHSPPSHEPGSWILLLAGSVSLGSIVAFFAIAFGLGWHLVPLVLFALAGTARGGAEILPTRWRGIARALRVVYLICTPAALIGGVVLLFLFLLQQG
jgi:hypothetical protein